MWPSRKADPMRDLVREAPNLVWVVGLAMLLAGWSLRRYGVVAGESSSARDAMRAEVWLRGIGALLFFAGLIPVVPTWWQRLAACAGAFASILSILASRRAPRPEQDRQSSGTT